MLLNADENAKTKQNPGEIWCLGETERDNEARQIFITLVKA